MSHFPFRAQIAIKRVGFSEGTQIDRDFGTNHPAGAAACFSNTCAFCAFFSRRTWFVGQWPRPMKR
jgi:hypothetical protein